MSAGYKYEGFADKYLDQQTHGSEEVMVRCLFHDESNASMQFNLNTGLFLCFGCKAAGNIQTLERHLGIRGGIYLDDVDDLRRKLASVTNAEDVLPVLPDSELERYNFPTKYWKDRGFDSNIIEAFELGFDMYGDKFDGKYVTIPIRNIHGELLGVIKRYTAKDVQLRYRYPKGFKRSQNLFASWMTQATEDIDFVVLTEGSIDAMKVWQAGYPAMAIYGSSISAEQVDIIRKMGIKKVVTFFDNDKAGKECTQSVTGFKVKKRGSVERMVYNKETDMRKRFLMYRAIYPRGYPSDPGDMTESQIEVCIENAKPLRRRLLSN